MDPDEAESAIDGALFTYLGAWGAGREGVRDVGVTWLKAIGMVALRKGVERMRWVESRKGEEVVDGALVELMSERRDSDLCLVGTNKNISLPQWPTMIC